MNTVVQGDAVDLIPSLPNRGVSLFLFSPPYAGSRAESYPTIAEKDYPAWMVSVMAAVRPKLTPDGSVLIVIRSHVRDGVVSDYVMRTRLALRDDGWKENEELIWYKSAAAFFGSKLRLRRSFENVLWFSKSKNPYINLTANGDFSDRIGLQAAHRFRNSHNPLATKRSSKLMIGKARGSDVFVAPASDSEEGIMHPAMYPISLCEQLIQTFSPEGSTICDPFCGAASTGVAALRLGRSFVGFEIVPKYVALAKARLNRMQHASVGNGSGSGIPFGFPNQPKSRKAFVLSKGLNKSDARIFNLVCERTENALEAAASLSFTDIADATTFSRRTAIRSIQRLKEADLVHTSRSATLHHHAGSLIGIAPSLLKGDKKR
jgi:site-specific DNA-methyltransferase (adenine-specific)/site-specific DNA-methyltransferase (cytosine-N4-specific)